MRNSLADDVVFILMEFRNAQYYSNWKYLTDTFRTLDIRCSFVCLNFSLFRIIQIACCYCAFFFFRFIQFKLLCNKKNKGSFNGLQKKIKKNQHTIKLLSSREHPKVLLCCAAPTFMLLYYSLFLKFVNNFEISCQGNESAL